MNKRTFAVALLLSALPVLAFAGSVSFDKADFRAAQTVNRDGRTVVRVKLTKAGKAKVRRLNRDAVGTKVHSEIAGVGNDFLLREPIRGNSLEMGPFSPGDAQKVVAQINQ